MRLVKLAGILIFIAGLLSWFFLLQFSHESFISFIIKFYGIPGKEIQISKIITAQKFTLFKTLPVFLSLIGLMLLFFSEPLVQKLKLINKSVLNGFFVFRNSFLENFALLGLILILASVIRIYFAFSLPVSYDEAWTFINFSSKGILPSISYYPAPNNHILHSFLTNISFYFPFNQTFNLRIPAILANLSAITLFFIGLSKEFDKRVAFVVSLLFISLFPIIYYGYNSRGYSLVLFAFIVCFFSAIYIIKQAGFQNLSKYYFFFSSGGVIGFYTMPSFLYPYFALVSFLFFFFLFKKDLINLKSFTLYVLATTIFVLLLYSPVFLASGIKSVIGNEYVAPISRIVVIKNLFSHFSATSMYLFNVKFWILIGFVFLASPFLIFRKENLDIVYFILYITFISPFIIVAHSVIPFPRTWIYLIIPVLYIIGLLLKQVINSNRYFILILSATLLFSGFLLFDFNKKIFHFEGFSFAALRLSENLIGNEAENVYCNHPLIETNLIYLFEEKRYPAKVEYSRFSPIDSDPKVLNQANDFLVIEEKIERIQGYEFIADYGFNLYLYRRIE